MYTHFILLKRPTNVLTFIKYVFNISDGQSDVACLSYFSKEKKCLHGLYRPFLYSFRAFFFLSLCFSRIVVRLESLLYFPQERYHSF